MAETVYLIGSLTSSLCAVLLLSRYRRSGTSLLLWSGLCFTGLALSNILRFVDLILLPQVDLYGYRLALAAVSMMLLLYGLIWESE